MIKAITLRNLPPELERAIVEKSEREGISVTKAATQMLESAIHGPRRKSDFDEFGGTWTREAANEFDTALVSMRVVDPEDWYC